MADWIIRKSRQFRKRHRAVYFNFAELPFMFVFTLFITGWWFFSVSLTYFTNTFQHSFGFLFFFLSIIPALIATKIVSNPFKGFFKHFNSHGDASLELLGREATLQTNLSADKIGMAEINMQGNPIKIYVKLLKSDEELKSGSTVLIINQSDDKKTYFVEPY